MKKSSLFLFILFVFAFSTAALNSGTPFNADNYMVSDIEITCAQKNDYTGCDEVFLENSYSQAKTSTASVCEPSTKSLWFAEESFSFVELGTLLSLKERDNVSDDLLISVRITEEMLSGTDTRFSFTDNGYTISFTITRF
jgi:hypothetical protein